MRVIRRADYVVSFVEFHASRASWIGEIAMVLGKAEAYEGTVALCSVPLDLSTSTSCPSM